jgi:hypothetical protein
MGKNSAPPPGGTQKYPWQTSGGSGPQGPDYVGAAGAQGASGVANIGAQTGANRPDQSTDFASSQWTQGPDGQWQQHLGLTGEMAGLSGELQNNAFGAEQGPMFGNLGSLGDGQQAIDASYNQAKSRLDPQWAQSKDNLDTQLANQGLDPNAPGAGQRAEGNFDRARTDAYQTAENNAVQQGIAQQGMQLQQRGQLAGEDIAGRQVPMQQLQQLLGFEGMPQFVGAGAAPATPYLGAMQGQGNYQLGQADQNNQLMGGFGQFVGAGLGAGFGAASDERVKEDVHREGREVLPGVPSATFRYKGDKKRQKYRGVIAQDVERAGHGHLVREGADGVKRVDASLRPFAL